MHTHTIHTCIVYICHAYSWHVSHQYSIFSFVADTEVLGLLVEYSGPAKKSISAHHMFWMSQATTDITVTSHRCHSDTDVTVTDVTVTDVTVTVTVIVPVSRL
jgi:hypothetical protein